MTQTRDPDKLGLLRSIWSASKVVPALPRTVVVIGLTIAGLFELFGLATIIPLFAIMDPASVTDVGGRRGALRDAVADIFAFFGLPVSLASMLAIIVLFLAIKAAIGIQVARYVAGVIAKINTDTRLDVVRTLMQARWSFYARQRLSYLVTAAGESSNAVGESFQTSADLLTSFLRIFVYLFVCYLISPAMVLLAAAVAMLMAVSYGHLVRQSKRAAKSQNKAMRQMNVDLTDVFVGMKSIRAMGRQAQMATLLSTDSEALDNEMRSRILSTEYAEELQAPLIAISLVLGLLGGSMLLKLAGQELLLIAILLVRLANTFGFVQRATERLSTTQVRVASTRHLIAEAAASQEQFTGTVLPDPRHGVRFESVSCEHADGKKILNKATFAVAPGRITTLTGGSGVGKTTTLDLILGLLPPSGGAIVMGGIDSAEVDLLRWRQMIGYVPQEVTMFHDSVRNNITLGEEQYSDADIWAALRAAGADRFIEELPLGLDHVVGERGQMISGGQRQRIALARALLHRPAILILDEATTGLDRETEAAICAGIREMAVNDGLTVLAVSHNDAWRTVADTMYRISNGSILPFEHDTGAEIIPLGR